MVSRVTRACAGQATCAGQKLLAAVGVTAGGERCGTRCCTQGGGTLAGMPVCQHAQL